MTEKVESVPLQTPLVGLQMDADTAKYVGMLEGTIAALCINQVKYRALLELLTGEPWEDTKIDMNGEVLQQLAISSLAKQTGMNIANAKVLVAKRWNERNQPTNSIVPVAVPVEAFAGDDASIQAKKAQVSPDMSARLQAYRAKNSSESDALSPPE